MSVVVPCSGCGKQLTLPDAARGKRAKCSSCQAVIDVPTDAPTRVAHDERRDPSVCATCGKKLTLWNRAVGESEPQCNVCYRKAHDISLLVKNDPLIGKASGGTQIGVGIGLIVLAFALFAIDLALPGPNNLVGGAGFVMGKVGFLISLVAGIAAIASGVRKRRAAK
jgi:LSD1 subclass zinc finger protein